MLDTYWTPGHDKVLRQFENYLTILDRRPGTVDSYLRAARDFLQHSEKSIQKADSKDVLNFLLFLKEEKGLSGSSLNQKKCALGMLFRDVLGRPLPENIIRNSHRKPGRETTARNRQSQTSDHSDDDVLGRSENQRGHSSQADGYR